MADDFPTTFILRTTVWAAKQRRTHPASAVPAAKFKRGDLTLEVIFTQCPGVNPHPHADFAPPYQRMKTLIHLTIGSFDLK
jgi:hypothetical protein